MTITTEGANSTRHSVRDVLVDNLILGRILSPQQRLCMVGVANGLTNRQIGALLHLSTNTVKSHLWNSYKLLGARNRNHAVAICLRTREIHLREIVLIDPEQRRKKGQDT